MIRAVTAAFCASLCLFPHSVFAQARSTVTLSELLTRAREASPAVQAARARARATANLRSSVPILPNPSVELRRENYGAPLALPPDVFATVSQPIELGGKRGSRQREATATARLDESAVTFTEWMVAGEVADAFVTAVRAREMHALLIEQRDSLQELVRAVDARVREGVAAEADLRRFEAEHTRLLSQIARTSLSAIEAVNRLAVLTGVRTSIEALAPPGGIALEHPVNIDQLAERRPDVRTATARVDRAEAELARERGQATPDVVITAGYKRTSGFDTAVGGLNLTVPLFDRNRTAVAVAGGEAAAARFELERVRSSARADIESRWAAAAELSLQASSAQAALVEPAAIVRSAARAAYAEGRGGVLEVVDAERIFGEASREAIELQLDAVLAVIQARLAIGAPPLP